LVSEYKLFKRSNKANLFFSPGPVACFSDEDDVSGKIRIIATGPCKNKMNPLYRPVGTFDDS
jgi:hypothetical protein